MSDASEEAGGTPALPGGPPEADPDDCVQPAMTQESVTALATAYQAEVPVGFFRNSENS